MSLQILHIVVFLSLALFGCERDFPIIIGNETEGYQIVGKLTDVLGNPVVQVPIKMYYDFQHVDDNLPASTDFDVTNGAQVIRVRVYDSENRLIRTLYNGVHNVGTMRIVWNKMIAQGVFAPSGVYTVQFIIENEVRKSYPVVVNETITAVTDTSGAFEFSDKHLPVGFYPVPLYSSDNSQYYGQFRITNVVALEFITEATTKAVLVSLSKGTISRVNVILE